jgi:nucleotide-binding universal stress UspA family protein
MGPTDSTRILIAYDGSTGAADAVRAAGQLFPGARACSLYVSRRPPAAEHGQSVPLAGATAAVVSARVEHQPAAGSRVWDLVDRGRIEAGRAGLDATADLRISSSAWRALLDAARDEHADVIVSGTRGRGAFSRSWLGSTSSSLLHHADRPLLVVPPGGGEHRGPTAIGYDGSDAARDAIATVARLLPGRPVIVVHAWPSPRRLDDVEEFAADVTATLAAEGQEVADAGAGLAREHGLEARAVSVEAWAGTWRDLAAAATAHGAALIVTGCRGRGAIGATILGSVSAGLVHNAELPVLVVR